MRFDAVLFDCDGVLVDSEPITMRVLRQMLAEAGWPLTLQACMAHFVGVTVRSQRALIETHTGQPLTEAWMDAFYARRNDALRAELQPVPGAHAAVQAARAHTGGRVACASGADRLKVEMQLAQTGLAPLFGAAVFSGHEMPASKPAPDVYLAAARHLQAEPARCLVVEDTPTGITAGVAAGATVWAYCPPGAPPEPLLAAGAIRLLARMDELATALPAA
ncbi:MAG: HAD family phosphatase [Comamonadaceae bacterium]|nr:HAD family phosphatase [Comamonadaceae bacterium]RRD56699.1 HAD family phosphatase [Comamonadaceae bacterium OH2545_COT-014]